MTLFVGEGSSLKRQRASQVAGFAAVMSAAAALIGWWLELPPLLSWSSGFAAVTPVVVALCLAALGLALVRTGKDSRFAFAVGLAVATLAAFGLAVVPFEVELGINQWLAGPEATSLLATNAAMLGLMLAGGSLAFSRFARHRFAATTLASIAGAIAVVALLSYLTGIDTLYGSPSIRSPPLATTFSLLCVATGIILRTGTMPALHKPRPSWQLLIMLGCAIILPLLLFGAYTGVSVGNAQLVQVRKELRNGARTLSAEVDREIVGEVGRLEALAASPSLRQGDFAEFQRQAEASLALEQSGTIALIGRDMRQLANTWAPFGTPLEETAVRNLCRGLSRQVSRKSPACSQGPRAFSWCLASSCQCESKATAASPSSGWLLSIPSSDSSPETNCRQVGMRWFPTPTIASSPSPTGRICSSGRSCRGRSGIAPHPRAYSNLSTPKGDHRWKHPPDRN